MRLDSHLSIVTPTLNSASTLAATLASIQPLVAEGAEHIVVDSYSTDDTVEIAERHGTKVIQHPKGNMYEAINAGMAVAKGDWLTYINSDDLLYPDSIEDILATVDDLYDLCYGNIDRIDATGRFLFPWRSPPPHLLKHFIPAYSPIPQQGVLFRRSVFDSLGGFDTSLRYSADYDFFVRALVEGHRFFKYTSRSIAAFRIMPSQLSQASFSQMAPEGIEIRRRLNENQSSLKIQTRKAFAFLYRNVSNLDNHLIKLLLHRL
jgi:glycosyltransferase involved in cell wall biosynthesis